MKMIRMILILAIALVTTAKVDAQKKEMKTVVFEAGLHCVSCKAKVEKNIPFEKGVKDLQIDMEKKTITITFREDKNKVENLKKAIEKLNIPVTSIDGKACSSIPGNANCQPGK